MTKFSSHFTVSRETEQRFDIYAALFEKWASSINLVAPSTKSAFWDRHVADSLQIYHLFPGPKQWVDLGSGAGFPGIVTAIALAELGSGWVHLVESNHKKAAFLRAAILETGARASVHALRIETVADLVPVCDAISARALADLDMLLEFSEPWMNAKAECRAFFHKGRDYEREVNKALGRWEFDLVKHDSVVEPDSVVLEIAHLKSITS